MLLRIRRLSCCARWLSLRVIACAWKSEVYLRKRYYIRPAEPLPFGACELFQ